MNSSKEYLPGLTPLRFFAALIVLVGHCRQNLENYGIRGFENWNIFFKGEEAVNYFFVLSGFLLTYFALREYTENKKIDIKKFFLRRIKRIFPLYYLSVLFSYFLLGFILPGLKSGIHLSFPLLDALPLYILLLPNYVIAQWGVNINSLLVLWSIGVEVQFYLFFPYLISFILKQKKILQKIIILAILYFLAYWIGVSGYFLQLPPIAAVLMQTLKFHMMLIGVAFAIMLFYHEKAILRFINPLPVQILIWVSAIAMNFTPPEYDPYSIVHAIIFGFLLLIVSVPYRSLINIEKRPWVYLGTISYGIYIFHPFVSYLLRYGLEKSPTIMEAVHRVPFLYFGAELSIAIVLAHLSYKYYESRFLSGGMLKH